MVPRMGAVRRCRSRGRGRSRGEDCPSLQITARAVYAACPRGGALGTELMIVDFVQVQRREPAVTRVRWAGRPASVLKGAQTQHLTAAFPVLKGSGACSREVDHEVTQQGGHLRRAPAAGTACSRKVLSCFPFGKLHAAIFKKNI